MPGRYGSLASSGRWQKPFLPFSPTSIFTRDMTTHPRASSQVEARKLANQMNYANKNFVNKEGFNGAVAPSFYGYAGIGYGENKLGFQTVVNLSSFTPAVFIVPAGYPTQKVTLVNNLREPREAGYDNNLQNSFNAVPVPLLELVPAGKLTSEGTDKELVILQLSANGLEVEKAWEMWSFAGTEGNQSFQYGACIAPGSTHGFNGKPSEWNGIFTPGEGGQIYGARATGLACMGGLITHQDLVEVLRTPEGEDPIIRHALEIASVCNINEHVAPATRNDTIRAIPKEHEGESNPAYPEHDGLREGAFFALPPEAHYSEFGISRKTEPLTVAVFRGIQKHGMFICDSGGTNSLYLQWYGSLGTPFSPLLNAKVNPFAGASGVAEGYKKANEVTPASWTDESLPHITQALGSSGGGVMEKLLPAAASLEVLEPFAS